MEEIPDLWLLKCSGRVLGPHSTLELKQLILDHEVMALDEASSPKGRWIYLRDISLFAPIFIALKNREEFLSDDTNGADTHGTDIPTITASQTLPPNIIGFRNPSQLVEGMLDQLKEAKAVNAEDGQRSGSGAKGNSAGVAPLRTFGSNSDPAMKRRVQKKSSQGMLWLLGFLIIGALLGAQVQSRRAASAVHAQNFEELYASATRANRRGDFDKAKELYNSALLIRPKDEELILQVVPILIDHDETVAAKRYLEDIQNSTKSDTVRAYENLLGLAFLKSGEILMAQAHFQKALNVDDEYVPALHNAAAAALARGQFKSALDFSRKAILKKNTMASTPLLFGEAAVGLFRSGDQNAKNYVAEAISFLRANLVSTYDYSFETKVLTAYLAAITRSNSQDVEKSVELLGDEDPQLTSDHIHDLRFYGDRANSIAVLQWLRELMPLLPTPTPRIKGIIGYVQFRGRDKQEGKQIVVDAVEQSPSDPILLALRGFVLNGAGNEGQTYFDLAVKYAKSEKLPHILKARNCQEKNDFVCATKEWQSVAAQDPQYPPAVIGIAESQRREGQLVQAFKLVESHIYRSPNYRPYIDLQMDLEEKAK